MYQTFTIYYKDREKHSLSRSSSGHSNTV